MKSDTDFIDKNHLVWMCNTAISRLEDGDFPIDKASRWLGYIQGILVSTGDINVMTERNFTRPLFTKV